MKIGIMQPYFFPYIGYWQLIKNTDLWVVFDDIQYIRHGWVNRNRILSNNFLEPQYIIVPLKKHSQNETIKNVHVLEDNEWKEKLLRQLEHYKKRAPYYNEAINLVRETIFDKYTTISELNIIAIKNVCKYLDIPIDIKIYSQMDLNIASAFTPGDWALEISKALNANTYINPIGGIELFDKQKYLDNNIDIKFLKPLLKPYVQKNHGNFVEGLSIIDVIMFNNIEEIGKMLNDYELL